MSSPRLEAGALSQRETCQEKRVRTRHLGSRYPVQARSTELRSCTAASRALLCQLSMMSKAVVAAVCRGCGPACCPACLMSTCFKALPSTHTRWTIGMRCTPVEAGVVVSIIDMLMASRNPSCDVLRRASSPVGSEPNPSTTPDTQPCAACPGAKPAVHAPGRCPNTRSLTLSEHVISRPCAYVCLPLITRRIKNRDKRRDAQGSMAGIQGDAP